MLQVMYRYVHRRQKFEIDFACLFIEFFRYELDFDRLKEEDHILRIMYCLLPKHGLDSLQNSLIISLKGRFVNCVVCVSYVCVPQTLLRILSTLIIVLMPIGITIGALNDIILMGRCHHMCRVLRRLLLIQC